MRHGQKHFCYTGNFCGKRCYSKQQKRKRDFLRRSKKSVFFFFWKSDFKKKQIRNMMEELLFFSDVKWQKFRKYILGFGLNKCCVKKKRSRLSCLKEQDWKTNIRKRVKQKKGDRTKKSFTKRDEQMKKEFFFFFPKKNEK